MIEDIRREGDRWNKEKHLFKLDRLELKSKVFGFRTFLMAVVEYGGPSM